MAVKRDQPDRLETDLQADPMIRSGRASRGRFWTIAGVILVVIVLTLIGLNNRISSPHGTSAGTGQTSSTSTAQPAPSTGQTTGQAPRN